MTSTITNQYLVLSAGAPHHGEIPAVLHDTRMGTSVLDWLLDTFEAKPSDVTIVAGYHAAAIRGRYPLLSVVENLNWKETGSGASLLSAPIHSNSPLIASYGDILFRAEHIHALESFGTPVTIAWDSAWRYRYTGRSAEDLARCEKVTISGERVARLGADIPVDWADGEFIGLVYFSPEALHHLITLRDNLPESLQTEHLSALLEYLRLGGLEVGAVDVSGDWAEINAPQDIAHFILGTKAETLQRLRGMVKSAVIQDQIAFCVVDWQRERNNLIEKVRERFHDQLVVVRSSARSEDSFETANAGAYTSVLNVNVKNGLAQAVDRVIASYGKAESNDQILIQPMVRDVVLSGVAFTRTLEHGAPWYVVNYETKGNTESITSGNSDSHLTLLVRHDAPDGSLTEPRLDGLLHALREIEKLLGYDALDVEFAVDAEGEVHILQVRPITVSHEVTGVGDEACNCALEEAKLTWQRLALCPPHIPGSARALYGLMPDWNPAEIIGTCPGALAEGLYRYLVMDEVWATQRAEFGYRDVRPAPLLVSFAGRPYVDVRASLASFIPANVPNKLAGRLLEFYLEWLCNHPELHDKVEFEVVPTCLGPGFDTWAQRFEEEGDFSKADVAVLREGLHGITRTAFTRYKQDLEAIENLATRFETIELNRSIDPLERAFLLLDDCRRLGMLPFAHLARSAFVAVTLLRGAEADGVISTAACESFFSSMRTISHRLTIDAQATAQGDMSWELFVERYGHLRPGTYEVTSPRYDDDPERFLRPLVEHADEAEFEPENIELWQAERSAFIDAMGDLGLPMDVHEVEDFLRQAIEGREYAKFVFSRNLSAALEALAEVGELYGLTRRELAEVSLDAILALRDSRQPGQDKIQQLRELAKVGREARMVAIACELPPLITQEYDLETFVIGADRPNFIGTTAVTASSIDLSTHDTDKDLYIAGQIVLIPQADPGYDWLFGQGIAALITQYGGANSHMAIRAAEFGLPAAIGIGEQRYRGICKAQVLELDPANEILRVVR